MTFSGISEKLSEETPGKNIKESLKEILEKSMWKILRESIEKFPLIFVNKLLEEFPQFLMEFQKELIEI